MQVRSIPGSSTHAFTVAVKCSRAGSKQLSATLSSDDVQDVTGKVRIRCLPSGKKVTRVVRRDKRGARKVGPTKQEALALAGLGPAPRARVRRSAARGSLSPPATLSAAEDALKRMG